MIVNGLWTETSTALLRLFGVHLLYGFAVVLLVGGILRWRNGVNASTRHHVWMAALWVVFLMPVLTILPWPEATGSLVVERQSVNRVEWTDTAVSIGQNTSERDVSVSSQPVEVSSPEQIAISAPWPLGWLLCLVWMLGSAWFAYRLYISGRLTRHLALRAVPVDQKLLSTVQPLLNAMGLRSVPIRYLEGLDSPVTLGLLHPWIAIPASWQGTVEPKVLNHVLLHELAHIKRGDPWAHGCQRLLQALLWLHPAVWVIGRQIDLNREAACDDWAADNIAKATDYAKTLVRVAEERMLWGSLIERPTLSMACVRSESQLRRRIARLLDASRNHRRAPSRVVVMLSAMAMVLSLGTSAYAWQGASPLRESLSFTFTASQNVVEAMDFADFFAREVEIDEADGLLYAAWVGDVDLVEDLLQAGANPNRIYRGRRSPRTALNAAAIKGELEVVQMLVDAGADINRVVRGDAPALTAAIRRGANDVAIYLLDKGAKAENPTRGDASALIYAAARGSEELVTRLLEAGADPNTEVVGDGSPMIAAARRGELEVMDLLLAAGAEPDEFVAGDESPMFFAVVNGHMAMVIRLLDEGADANRRFSGDGTLLMLAIKNRHAEVAQLLMEHGADPSQRSVGDGNALIQAVRHTDVDLVSALIEAGADVNDAVDGDGNPLINAAARGRVDMVQILIAAGAEINSHARGDDTPLIAAVRRGHFDVAKALIDAGADVNMKGDFDRRLRGYRTPLNQLRDGDSQVRRLLIEAGAS